MITQSSYGRSTLRLFRNVQNDLDFLIKDIDRQPIALTGTVTFHVWDDSGSVLIEAICTVINPQRGHYRVSITGDATSGIRSGIYVWSMTNENNGTTKLLYTNADYGPRGILEIHEGVMLPIDAPIEITAEDMTPLNGDLYSSALAGSLRSGNQSGNHTAVVYLDSFTGRLKIEGCIEDQIPTTSEAWTEIENIAWENESDPQAINWSGNYTYVRFTITAAGFQKLQYRN